jgi:hypothetical protein
MFEISKERLSEPSTWRGIVYLLTAIALFVDPGHAETIIEAGLGLAGSIAVTTKG